MKDAIKYIIIIGIVFLPVETLMSQEIDFGSYGSFTIILNQVTLDDLEFEEPITIASGKHEIGLSESKIVQIIGVKHLDVGVLISADGELFLDGDPANSGDPLRSIPFTLYANYSNKGAINNERDTSIQITSIVANSGNIRFPILERQFTPPGPPPLPPGTFDQEDFNETAEIYLYGEIDVGNVAAGTYSGIITITVEYDSPPAGHP